MKNALFLFACCYQFIASAFTLSQYAPSEVCCEPLCQRTVFSQSGECVQYYIGSNYLAGCDPIAWAQVLTYYGLTQDFPSKIWQPTPVTNSVFVDNQRVVRTTLSGSYEWEAIADKTLQEVEPKAPLGRLVWDLGVLGHAAYTSGGGTAGTLQVADLKSYFGYASGYTYSYERETFYTETTPIAFLETMLVSSLRIDAPIVLHVNYPGIGAHMIVCDGYGYTNDTLFLHLDLGFGAGWYGWATLNDLASILNVYYPLVAPKEVGCMLSGRVTDGKDPLANVWVHLSDGQAVQTNAQGIYLFSGLKPQSEVTVTIVKAGFKSHLAGLTFDRFVDDSVRTEEQDAWDKAHDKEDNTIVPFRQGNLLHDIILEGDTSHTTGHPAFQFKVQ